MTIFLPWRGEFGMMLMKWVRYVNGYKSSHKIICATKGSEALYPSAAEFYYDWELVDDIKKNSRLIKSSSNNEYLKDLRERLLKIYPGSEIVYPSLYLENKREWNFIPQSKIARGFQTDVVVGPRYRQYGKERNFEHWQEIITRISSSGYTVSAIGAKETSVPDLQHLHCKSWEHDFLDAGIELLKNCKLAITSCSGPAHLAVLCSTPLLVIYDEYGRAVDGKGRWYIEKMQAFATNYCQPIVHGWNDPSRVVDHALAYLSHQF